MGAIVSATKAGLRLRTFPAGPTLGALVWLVGVAITLPGWAPTLLLLAPFVAFPLGLDLVDRASPRRSGVPRWLLLPCALPLLVSFALERGHLAASLALPWLALTVGLALEGTWRLGRAPRWLAMDWGIAAALVFPSVGAAGS